MGVSVCIVPPGIICKNMWVCSWVRFSKNADIHRILKVIYDHKTTRISLFWEMFIFSNLFLFPTTLPLFDLFAVDNLTVIAMQ